MPPTAPYDRQTFLLQLGDRIRDLADADAIVETTVDALGVHLGASRVVYAEIDADGHTARVVADWSDGSLPSLVGEHTLDPFGDALARQWRAGRAARIDDVANDHRVEISAGRAMYEGLGVAASMCTPLLRHGRLAAMIAVDSVVPRTWTDAEFVLLQEVAERTREAVERAIAEAAGRESEARYRMLFDSIAQGFCTIDVLFDDAGTPCDYRFVEVNASFTRQTGMHDAIGRTMLEYAPDHEQVWFDTYGRVATTGVPESFEAQARALGRWYEVYAFRVGEPEQRRVGVLFNDISDRRLAELALRESELRLSTLVEGIPQLVWRARSGGDATWTSPQWGAFTGQGFDASLGQGWLDVVHPDDREASMQAWSRASKLGLHTVDHRIRRADGTWVWHATRARPLRDSSGEIVEWLGTTTDVQRLMELQEEKDRLVAQLAEADRRKDEFLATLAHELRNPLAPLTNAVQVLGMVGGDAERIEQMRRMIERQLRHMARLVDDLLDVSRISRGQVTLRRRGFDLVQVVRGAVESCQPLVDAQEHALVLDLPDTAVPVLADETRIAQAVANLVNNAAKYTPRGGHLRVQLRRGAGTTVEVVVADDGVGIPPELLPGVFEMFVQAPGARGNRHGGLGLGLAIARQMAEMHGGTLVGHSDGPGTGCTFVLTLPVCEEAMPAARDETCGHRPGALRVLVVDDNRDAADSMASLLRAMGHDVRVAYGGVDGLAQAGTFVPQIALLDIGMPDMDGHALARAIRALDVGPTMLLVALTGWGQHDDRERSRAAGFDEHVAKPIDVATLERLLARRQALPA